MSDNEEGPNEDVQFSMRDRILAILGSEHGKIVDGIVFNLDRLADSKPALLVDYEVSFEKLERFAPPGLCIVEIAGRKIIVNLSLLEKRMPWGESRQHKPPIFVDISPGLARPRILNAHDLPEPANVPGGTATDTIKGNSNLYYMTEEICDMMRDIVLLIANGERVIERRREWHAWCPATIWGCLLSLPVVWWSDSETEKTCLVADAPVWEVEWFDGEAKRRLYSFCIPHDVMTPGLKQYLQRWTDSLTLPHQNCYMLQTKSSHNPSSFSMM